VIRALALCVCMACTPGLVLADAALVRLSDLLAVEEYVDIARAEGLKDAEAVSRDMLGRPADAGFLDQMSEIYDVDRMQETVMGHLTRLSEPEIDASIAYFQTDAAVRITELEVAARRAMMDEEVEMSARQAWTEADTSRPDLFAQIEEMSSVNDLVERNVSGALNSNLRYYQGLADGGGLQLSEEEILTLVWGQEENIRAETEEWLGGYFLLAYQPLEAEDLEGYVDFWNSPAGEALNAVLFEGFNHVYDDVSYATGRVLALNMLSQDL
jgi:hypothetical protein